MEHWRESVKEVATSMTPIVFVILVLKVTLLDVNVESLFNVVFGSAMAMVGLSLFLFGARLGILAFGERLGSSVPQFGSIVLLLLFGVILGFAVTVAEPDVRVLQEQVENAAPNTFPNGSLIVAIAIGVALFVGLSLLRTALQLPLVNFLIPGYLLLFLLAAITPPEYMAVAFDSGGVTTGPLTVPFILAFSVGVASVLGRRSGVSDSFGIVALASIGPVAAVLVLGLFLGGRA